MPEFDAPRGQRQVGDNGRLARQWGALTSDLRAWIELRVALIEAQLTERVRRELLYRGVQGMMYVAAGMFLLAGGAWGLGEVFGHPAYGFAVIGGVMGACASIVHWVRIRAEKQRVHGPGQPTSQRLGGAASAETEDEADRAASAGAKG